MNHFSREILSQKQEVLILSSIFGMVSEVAERVHENISSYLYF